ncbi:MAG: DUF4493 domain-containing protein, partial [Duncaniella sp.]|nr:DUF4493 domain-containing protein [Duncaniella sp.]
MMKTRYAIIAGSLLLGVAFTSCRDEQLLEEGQGRMMLHTSVMNDIKVVSRALSNEEIADLSASATIWISDSKKGRIHTFTGLASFPTEGLPLEVGSYVAEAWVGDSVPASWDKKRFRGVSPFEISKGVNTQVDLECHIRNTLVSVIYDPDIDQVLGDYSLTVSLNDGVTDGSHSLVFEGKSTDKGYFMINSRTRGLKFKLAGTDLTKNEPFEKEMEFKDAKVTEAPYLAHATEYKVNLRYDSHGEIKIGGTYFTLEIEPEPVEGEKQEIYINLAPDIKGVGFNINQPLVTVPGEVGRRSLYITTSSSIESVVVSGSLLEAAGASFPQYDLVKMESQHKEELSSKGIEFELLKRDTINPTLDTNMRINFEEFFTNTLAEGTYEMKIVATDGVSQETEKT